MPGSVSPSLVRRFRARDLCSPSYLWNRLRRLRSYDDFKGRLRDLKFYARQELDRVATDPARERTVLARLHRRVFPPRFVCGKVFSNMEIHSGGDAYFCCPKWMNKPIGNVGRQSLESVWNGETAQEIRRSILDQSFRYCDRGACPHLQTMRFPVQKIGAQTDAELRSDVNENKTRLGHGPRVILNAYDRSCNLFCPSCRTELIVERSKKDEILGIQDKLQNEYFKDIHELNISGAGDPFGSAYSKQLLRTLTREQAPRLRSVGLYSNGQLWTPEMWRSLSPEVKRRATRASISIDAATEATYAINRRGGDWRVLLENLSFIGSLLESGPLKLFVISMVVQDNNFEEMPAFVELGRKVGATGIHFTRLVDWGTFSRDEFTKRAVHHPSHPRHAEFISVLRSEALKDPRVLLENLTELAQG